ncbi:MAG: class I SAM-dependent methyltransferase [Elusimicrobiota bacterium]
MKNIKEHFEREAKEFDDIILRIIPFYEEMIEALVLTVPFEKEAELKVLDLGCGTGTILKKIKQKFSNARLTGVDISEKMIEIAKSKLKNYEENTKYYVKDFYDFKFEDKYDVIVSSLALHHLVTDEDKKNIYQKIYNALSENGIFYNADVVLASNKKFQNVYIKKWVEYMSRNCSREEIENKWLQKYQDEDNPAELIDQVKWLESIGFKNVDIVWKYYNLAVYGGTKKES